MKVLIIEILFVLIYSSLSPAKTSGTKIKDPQFDSLITTGIKQIYNIKFKDAERTFSIVMKKYPHHPAGRFFKAMIIWWKIMLDTENEEYDDLFVDKLDSVIAMCDSILEKDPDNVDALFFKGGSLGFRGRLYSLRKKWFDAALDGKEALPLVHKVYEIDPQNEEVKLGFGIYNYYAEAIPEKYPFIKPVMIFFPGGNKKLGIQQLKETAQKSKYASIEAKFFLLTLNYQFEENFKEAFKYAKELTKEFPDNPTFEKYLGRIYVKQGDYYKASNVFQDMLIKCNENLPGYNSRIKREASYYIGVKLEMEKKLDSALTMFNQCLKFSKIVDDDTPSGFWISAVWYLGKIYDEKKNIPKAIEYYKSLLDLPEYRDSHDKAEKYLEEHGDG